jgi:predicted metal-binding membrane protein
MEGFAEASRRPAQRVGALQLGLIGGLFALAGVAWAITRGTMSGMDMGPGTGLGSLSFYVGAWVVMMAAMMFPSISPMVRTYAIVQRSRYARRGLGQPTAAVVAFVAGYLVTWTAFGLVAYSVFNLVRSLHIGVFQWDAGGPYVAALVLIGAAGYQLTPLKDACLSRCRSPLDFLTERWRDGVGGALALGLEHGAWCVGCCWALMAALFALGVMSVAWMVFIAALIAAEKLLPWKRLANRGIAGLLVLLGLGVAFVPASVPGLTIPTQAAASGGSAMSGMRAPGRQGDPMGGMSSERPTP